MFELILPKPHCFTCFVKKLIFVVVCGAFEADCGASNGICATNYVQTAWSWPQNSEQWTVGKGKRKANTKAKIQKLKTNHKFSTIQTRARASPLAHFNIDEYGNKYQLVR
jgi:hypothetical protein